MNYSATIRLLLGLALLTSSSCRHSTELIPPPPPDTTSHNFVWRADSLGDGNSMFYDVAIVDDSLAYAVGLCYLKDSTGNLDYTVPYSLARWDGSKWELKALTYTDGGTSTPVTAIRGILVRSQNDIWLSGGSMFHWDGSSSQIQLRFSRLTLPNENGTIERVWGSANSMIYGAGYKGTFVYFDGSSWHVVPTGTDIDFVDVYGTSDGNIWIAGLDMTTGQRSVLLQWNGSQLRTAYQYKSSDPPLRQDSIGGVVKSAWPPDPSTVWVVANGQYLAPASTHGEAHLSWLNPYNIGFTWRIRGNGPNNVFVVGDFVTILHYNGSTWHHYAELMDFGFNCSFRAVASDHRSVFIVGWTNGRGFIYQGLAY